MDIQINISRYKIRLYIEGLKCDYMDYIQWKHNSVAAFTDMNDTFRDGYNNTNNYKCTQFMQNHKPSVYMNSPTCLLEEDDLPLKFVRNFGNINGMLFYINFMNWMQYVGD